MSFVTVTPTTEIYTLSLHDALPICAMPFTCTTAFMVKLVPRTVSGTELSTSGTEDGLRLVRVGTRLATGKSALNSEVLRSEEHTSELQSHSDLVCRLLLEKKKKITQ